MERRHRRKLLRLSMLGLARAQMLLRQRFMKMGFVKREEFDQLQARVDAIAPVKKKTASTKKIATKKAAPVNKKAAPVKKKAAPVNKKSGAKK
jgi:BMFP domain-containing protein YqiC